MHRSRIVADNVVRFPPRKPGRVRTLRDQESEGYTVTCPRCETPHFKKWRAATQRGLFADLCGDCGAKEIHLQGVPR